MQSLQSTCRVTESWWGGRRLCDVPSGPRQVPSVAQRGDAALESPTLVSGHLPTARTRSPRPLLCPPKAASILPLPCQGHFPPPSRLLPSSQGSPSDILSRSRHRTCDSNVTFCGPKSKVHTRGEGRLTRIQEKVLFAFRHPGKPAGEPRHLHRGSRGTVGSLCLPSPEPRARPCEPGLDS